MSDWQHDRAALAIERVFAYLADDNRTAANNELVHAVHEGVPASYLVDAVVDHVNASQLASGVSTTTNMPLGSSTIGV